MPLSGDEFFGLIFRDMMLVDKSQKSEEYKEFHIAYVKQYPTITHLADLDG